MTNIGLTRWRNYGEWPTFRHSDDTSISSDKLLHTIIQLDIIHFRQYKAKFSHTMVTQRQGKLGTWVSMQRWFYKWYRDGEKSQTTTEREKKLADIVFCFKARSRNG